MERGDDVRVTVFTRSIGDARAPGTRPGVVERLDELEEADRVDGYSVSVWGDTICPGSRCAETGVGRYVLDQIDAFHEWERETPGVELPFERRTVSTLATEATREVLRPPETCLAVRVDGELGSVLPLRFDDCAVSVHDYLDLLAALPSAGQFRAEQAVRPAGASGST